MNKEKENTLQVIEQRKVLGQDFKIYGDFENPLFLARNVAKWIEHSNSTTMINTVDEDEKFVITLPTKHCLDGLQANTQYTFLTEDGLYEVLMQSRKPIAKAFKKEVKGILKSIRKHGAYMTPEKIREIFSNPDTVIQLATNLKNEQEKVKKANKELQAKNQEIEKLKPKAEYTDTILQNKGLVTITQIAKDYGMSGQAMNAKLHELGVQYKQSNQWLLYKKHQSKGYTHLETVAFKHKDGKDDVKMNTKWTQKGRLFLYELLKVNAVLPVVEQP